jgi:pyruvate/2-oxoglutarate dehydrogenase complex dihydrolipoamide dehydrogenase (E3) component
MPLPQDENADLRRFDHVIVGAGQAMSVLVGGLPSGETIAVIEGADLGGSCVNVGCTPTKTLVASARVAHVARRASEYGVHTGDVRVDYGEVHARMQALRLDMRDGLERWLDGLPNVTLLRGWARFVGPRTLRVGNQVVQGDRIYLNVGARSRVPDLPGLRDVPWLDNVRVLDLPTLPERLVIIGASYIGLEFAQVFARLGSQVDVIERSGRIMPREDEDVCGAIREVLADEGITFHLGLKASCIREGEAGGVEVVLGEGDRVVAGTHLLVAVGRVPNTDRLDPAAGGVEVDERGFVVVDDQLRTSAERVFALGDVNGTGAFTHTSVFDGEIVLDVLRGGPRRVSSRGTAYALFTDPPLGRAGMSEREARASGRRVLKGVRPMTRVNRAREMGETAGFLKLLVDADTDAILGASAFGVQGDEIANMMAALMAGGVTANAFRRSMLIHPTVGELVPYVLDALEPLV